MRVHSLQSFLTKQGLDARPAPRLLSSALRRRFQMPTPESEAFKARKPTVPPTFEGVDFTNNQQVWDARDAIIREQWVKQMMARLVREELGMWCTISDVRLCSFCRDFHRGCFGNYPYNQRRTEDQVKRRRRRETNMRTNLCAQALFRRKDFRSSA